LYCLGSQAVNLKYTDNSDGSRKLRLPWTLIQLTTSSKHY